MPMEIETEMSMSFDFESLPVFTITSRDLGGIIVPGMGNGG